MIRKSSIYDYNGWGRGIIVQLMDEARQRPSPDGEAPKARAQQRSGVSREALWSAAGAWIAAEGERSEAERARGGGQGREREEKEGM